MDSLYINQRTCHPSRRWGFNHLRHIDVYRYIWLYLLLWKRIKETHNQDGRTLKGVWGIYLLRVIFLLPLTKILIGKMGRRGGEWYRVSYGAQIRPKEDHQHNQGTNWEREVAPWTKTYYTCPSLTFNSGGNAGEPPLNSPPPSPPPYLTRHDLITTTTVTSPNLEPPLSLWQREATRRAKQNGKWCELLGDQQCALSLTLPVASLPSSPLPSLSPWSTEHCSSELRKHILKRIRTQPVKCTLGIPLM